MDADADFEQYMAARWQKLVRSARLLGCSAMEAEDLAQTTLVRCYTAWRTVTAAHDRDAYVYRILCNCYAKSRSRRWWKEYPTGDRTPAHQDRDGWAYADVGDRIATELTLRSALQEISQDRRVVLVLRYYADLSEQQVASVLGVPLGTVKSRSHRGLTELQAKLGAAEGRADAREVRQSE